MLSKFEQKKCQLCSRLSSAFSGFFFRFVGKMCCGWINLRTHDRKYPDRVGSFNACAPGCACEAHPMSPHSPGVVRDEELVSRFIFSPMHVTKSGAIKPSLFSHAERQGCSVQRERAENQEVISFVHDFLQVSADHKWLGVVSARSGDLRALRIDGVPERPICVYDTAEPNNPAHAEACWSGVALEEGDAGELRKLLLDAFATGTPTAPAAYRNGEVLHAIAT